MSLVSPCELASATLNDECQINTPNVVIYPSSMLQKHRVGWRTKRLFLHMIYVLCRKIDLCAPLENDGCSSVLVWPLWAVRGAHL